MTPASKHPRQLQRPRSLLKTLAAGLLVLALTACASNPHQIPARQLDCEQAPKQTQCHKVPGTNEEDDMGRLR